MGCRHAFFYLTPYSVLKEMRFSSLLDCYIQPALRVDPALALLCLTSLLLKTRFQWGTPIVSANTSNTPLHVWPLWILQVATCTSWQSALPAHVQEVSTFPSTYNEGNLPYCAVVTYLPNTLHRQTVNPQEQMVHDSLWDSDHWLPLALDWAHSTGKLLQAFVQFSNDFAAKGSSCPSLSGSLEWGPGSAW